MYKIFAILVISTFALASCREKDTVINTSGTKPADTTYMADAEQPQAKVVLLEEFTGIRCVPCVTGHQIIYGPDGIIHQHPDQVAVIAYHIINHPQTTPVSGHSRFDFRTEDATNVGKTIFGVVGLLPSAGIDRKSTNNSYLLDREFWPTTVNSAVSTPPPVNLYLTSSYNASTRDASIKLKVAYTQRTEKKQAITLAVVEDNIMDAQETNNVGGETYNDNYTHHSVLRHIITLYYGEAIMDNIAVKEPGRVYERSFSYNINPAWNADNCRLVAFVHDNDGTDKDVLQAIQKPLK